MVIIHQKQDSRSRVMQLKMAIPEQQSISVLCWRETSMKALSFGLKWLTTDIEI